MRTTYCILFISLASSTFISTCSVLFSINIYINGDLFYKHIFIMPKEQEPALVSESEYDGMSLGEAISISINDIRAGLLNVEKALLDLVDEDEITIERFTPCQNKSRFSKSNAFTSKRRRWSSPIRRPSCSSKSSLRWIFNWALKPIRWQKACSKSV